MGDLKQLARRIFHDTLAAIDIPRAMQRRVYCEHSWLLRCDDEIAVDTRHFSAFRVVAIGKAAHAMPDGLRRCPRVFLSTELFRHRISPTQPVQDFEYFTGGHPIPNEDSWRAAEAILKMLSGCDQ